MDGWSGYLTLRGNGIVDVKSDDSIETFCFVLLDDLFQRLDRHRKRSGIHHRLSKTWQSIAYWPRLWSTEARTDNAFRSSERTLVDVDCQYEWHVWLDCLTQLPPMDAEQSSWHRIRLVAAPFDDVPDNARLRSEEAVGAAAGRGQGRARSHARKTLPELQHRRRRVA